MLFNTLNYCIFLPIVILIYYILPKKIRYIWLLVTSYWFYMNWNPKYGLLLFGCTLITYITGRILDASKQCILKKYYVMIAVVILLVVLGYFKYYNFFISYVNHILTWLDMKAITRKYDVLLPVGISFYILQGLGYVFDVYKGKVSIEKNFLKYALFLSFFPQLVAGPIERTDNLMVQLEKPHKVTWDDFRKAILWILYGLFCKMVIADRIAIVVENVYDAPQIYTGPYIMYAAMLFSFQIYCDFYGYSIIARGSALLLGIELVENFNAPYFAKSVKEFWRRWHISLSSWFRDYVYIPLGGNRKGTLRQKVNLLGVFTISGLWHGASLSFVIWGGLNGLYQIIENIVYDFKIKVKKRFVMKDKLIYKNEMGVDRCRNVACIIQTYFLISITWIFFSAGSLRSAIYIIKQMCCLSGWSSIRDIHIFQLGVNKGYSLVMYLGILILLLVDYFKYKERDVINLILEQRLYLRTLVYVGLVLMILLFGCYGEMYDAQQFIYFQF